VITSGVRAVMRGRTDALFWCRASKAISPQRVTDLLPNELGCQFRKRDTSFADKPVILAFVNPHKELSCGAHGHEPGHGYNLKRDGVQIIARDDMDVLAGIHSETGEFPRNFVVSHSAGKL
jgi:hypothetical protein